MLKKITSTLLYVAIFLLPIFFLPVTVFPLAWNKHILLLVLSFLALILWLINVIKSGELKLNWTKLSSAVFILLAVLAVSTIFSNTKASSFWSAISAESCLNFILYIIIFFLISNVFDKGKDIIKALIFLLISSALVNLLFLIQLFFGSVLPWDFAKAAGFNLIGSVWAMAVYLGGVTVLLIFLLGNSKIFKNKFYQLSGYLALILFLISLIIIGFKPVWLAVALSMIIVIWLKLKAYSPEKDAEFDRVKRIDLKLVYLPAVIFILAAILIVIKLPLAERFHLPNLITLNNQSTHSIAADTFKESFKNFIVGSGPATFEYQYVLHQPESIAQGSFWQTRFSQGKYALGTFLVEFGILGLIGFLLIIIFFLYSGFRTVILAQKESDQADRAYLQSAVLIAGFYFLLSWFLYLVDLTLFFIGFLILGLWTASGNNNRKEIIFTKSPQQAFFIMLLGIVIIAGAGIGLFYSGKKYVGAVNYSQAVNMTATNDFDIDALINLLVKTADLDSTNDLYLRELSGAYLIKIGKIQSDQLLAPEQKQSETQLTVGQLEMVFKKMIEINPKNSQNWEQAAMIYTNLTVLDPSAYQLAINNYIKAKELNPANPSILFNLAKINFNLAERARNQSQQTGIKEEDKNKLQTFYEQNLNSALENLDAAIKLKNNYTIAYYLRAVIYEFSEQYDLALANYGAAMQLEPGNEEIIKKVKEIQEKMKTGD